MRSWALFPARLSIAFTILLGCARAGASPCLHFEPEEVTLRGTLTALSRYGPPGYGENPTPDEKVQVPVLNLDQPVEVCGNKTNPDGLNTGTYHVVRQIQLVWLGSFDGYLQRHIVVTGTLFEAITAHHWTAVLLTVKHLQLAELRGAH
jgi:uncharacterized protein DUF4431